MRFTKFNLSQNIKKALDKMGFHKTTDIQFKAISAILKGEDVLAIAQTGTGKTAAFAIPVIDRIHREKSKKAPKGIRCLIMVPTRELALQISRVCQEIAQFTKVKSYALIGGVDQEPQIYKLILGVDILVSTPGRMFDFLNQGHLDFSNTHTLVLDEADLMLDLGFNKDIHGIIGHLPKYRQTLYFSATINPTIKKLAYKLVNNPIRIELSPKDPVSKNIEHWKIKVLQDDKRFFLERLIRENPDKKIIVFVRTKIRSERVFRAMQRVGITTQFINGDMTQNQRKKTLKEFKKGDELIMVATDVTARGIDIPEVEIVVNYDLPKDPEYYIHRIGRTGRGRSKGIAYSFVNEHESELLKEIELYISKPINELYIDEGFYKEVKQIPNEENIKMDDILEMIDSHENRKKTKKNKK